MRQLGKLLLKLGLCGLAVMLFFAAYLDAVVVQKFEGKKWAIPAMVYARPVELFEGGLIKPDELQGQLRRQGYQPVTSVSRPGTFSRSGNQFVIYSRGFHFPDGTQSSRYAHVTFRGNEVVKLTDRRKQALTLLRLDPQPVGGIYPASYEDRVLIRLDHAPKYLVPALIAVEDRDFYEHRGLSITSIARAFVVNVKAGSVVQGGSTLTQQLVKNFYLSNERTISRKVQEAVMSLLLELHYSKDEILETYLNEVYLGQQGRRAIHGFGMASQFYFSQPLQELNLARTALLVGIVKGPSFYDPRRFPDRALQRRNLVLDVMAGEGLVSQAEAERSKKLPLGVVSRELMQTSAYPAYLDVVKSQLRQDYAEKDLTSEGLRIFTNMDPIVQRHAQSSMTQTLKDINQHRLQGAMVVTSAQSGDLLAVVGDKTPGYIGFNRAIDARRPVGSLLKPAVYLTALEQPNRYTLTTPVKDLPIKVKDGRGGVWEPGNYDGKSRGEVPLYEALAKSYNQAATHTGMDVGVSNVMRTIRRLGVERRLPNYPSMILGSASLTPIEIAAMYQTIASGGFRMPIRAIDAVMDASGKPLRRYSLSVERVVDPAPMELLRQSMVSAMREGTGQRAYWSISKDISLAGKSGTTNDLRDSWFAGFSGNMMAVVWLGNDDNSPAKLTGSSGALRVWTDLMKRVPISSVQPLDSDRLEYVWVQPGQHLLSSPECQGARQFPYIAGSAPVQTDSCTEEVHREQTFFNTIKNWFE